MEEVKRSKSKTSMYQNYKGLREENQNAIQRSFSPHITTSLS